MEHMSVIRNGNTMPFLNIARNREGCKDQESIQSSTIPDSEHHMGKCQRRKKKSQHTIKPRGQPFPSQAIGFSGVSLSMGCFFVNLICYLASGL